MGERLSIAEIYFRFASEWVLLEDPEVDEQLQVLGGTVLWHSQDRDEVYQQAVERRPKHSAFLFTGTMPEGTEIVV